MAKFRYCGLTGIACVGLLTLAACGREGQDEMGWARAALERNSAIEVVAADQQSRTFTVRLKDTGELRMVRAECRATIGAVSNPDQQNIVIAKAGRNRWLGRRPSVRGVAMNPIDHPHGGGEGRTSGGRHPVTPWGKPTKGKKTRQNKATDRLIVRRRHKR